MTRRSPHARLGAAACLVQTQDAYAGFLLESGAPEDGVRARSLMEQAESSARALGLPALLEEATRLRKQAAALSETHLHELRTQLADAKARAARDPLTGLANRAAWDARLAALGARLEAGEPGITLVLLDLDHFKRVNDTHGHAAGDRALRAVAVLLRRAFGDDVFLARFGGEEFAALLEEGRPEAVLERLEEVRAAFHRANAGDGASPDWSPLTISIGAVIAAPGDTAEILVERADRALYAVKRAGRDGVRLAAKREPM